MGLALGKTVRDSVTVIFPSNSHIYFCPYWLHIGFLAYQSWGMGRVILLVEAPNSFYYRSVNREEGVKNPR